MEAPLIHTTLAFTADTQAPMWVETLWLKSHNNRKATQLLFEAVLQKHPASFFLLGDVVNLGYAGRQWKPIDACLKKFQNKRIPVHAILGNHEVMGRPAEGIKKFEERFPLHRQTGYVVVEGQIAVVLVNSNFSVLTPQQNKAQELWYRSTLESLEADDDIHFIIIGCHHSPFTNSRIVKPSAAVVEKFIPAFLASKKAVLFLSGHSHNYEHYKVGGKDFLVIGGGGGLRQPLRQGIGSLTDLAPDYKPLFHYAIVTSSGGSLHLTSYQINKDFNGFEAGLEMEIKPLV